jgi:hypothetical protein
MRQRLSLPWIYAVLALGSLLLIGATPWGFQLHLPPQPEDSWPFAVVLAVLIQGVGYYRGIHLAFQLREQMEQRYQDEVDQLRDRLQPRVENWQRLANGLVGLLRELPPDQAQLYLRQHPELRESLLNLKRFDLEDLYQDRSIDHPVDPSEPV